MPQFLLSYRVPSAYTSGSHEVAAAWTAFFEEIGSNLVELGRPAVEARALGNCGPGTRLGGYSLIEAEDIDAAASMAKACPTFDLGTGVEIGRVADVVDGRVVVED